MNTNEKDFVGQKWIKGRDGKIGFSHENRCKIWKEHIYEKDYNFEK